jgi:IclR family transcriptional regulator, KDG regulon repressor
MLQNAFEVLRLFTPNRTEIGVLEAAELLDRPISTVSRWLAAMGTAGFLDRDPASGRYRLGIQLIAFGEIARRSTFVQRLALPALGYLTQKTEETSTLGFLEDHAAFDAAVEESPRVIRPAAYVGRRYPLHPTAVGKVLLAWREREEVLRRLPDELPRYTEATIIDKGDFLSELELVRERGFGTAWCEWADDFVGIAAPLRGPGGRVLAALSLAVPVSRVSERDLPELGELLIRTADRVSGAMASGLTEDDDWLEDSTEEQVRAAP